MKKKLDRVSKTTGFADAKLGEATKKGRRQKEGEKKNSTKIKHRQHSHHRKSSPEYLFQVETGTSKLHVLCIPKKQRKTYKVAF